MMKTIKQKVDELKPALKEFYWLIREKRITEIKFEMDMSHRIEIIISKALAEQREEMIKEIEKMTLAHPDKDVIWRPDIIKKIKKL